MKSKSPAKAPEGLQLWVEEQKGASEWSLALQKSIIDQLRGELQGADGFEIENDEDFEFLGKLLGHSKAQLKEAKDKKEAVTKPINAALRAFQSWYLPPIKGWTALIDLIKLKMGAYERKKLEIREAAQLKLVEATNAGDFEAAMEASQGLSEETPEIEGLSSREVWIPDMDRVDLSKVQVPYLALDMVAVKQYIDEFVKEKERPPDLPGLPFKREIRMFGTGGGKRK